ncbi:molybdate ABC transporter substrate-binding protein [Cohnella sp.]|uniref:molybdate ABC transporter substrate-binding protein n=1 Tax=Cohnella sp. TaxID=1883426 RepID=UPI0035625026
MFKKWLWAGAAITGLLFVVLFLMGDNKGQAPKKAELIISAAASLQESLELLQLRFEALYPNIDLIFNYGSSGALQQQIEQGAPVDVYLSAGQKQMEQLMEQKLIENSQTIMTNELVLIVASDSNRDWKGLETLNSDGLRHIAIGQPESVPAGLYAQQALIALKLWDSVQNKLIYLKDVRQVLNTVETGNAEAGFVYATDAVRSTKVKAAIPLPENIHQPIQYLAGILTHSAHPEEALVFYQYLTAEEAQAIFAGFGFKAP